MDDLTSFKLNVNSELPLYRQLYHLLREEIISGKLPPASQLPSERELASNYGISRGTVQNTINLLLADKLVYKHQGRGVFVSSPALDPRLRLGCFLEEVRWNGEVHKIRVKRAMLIQADSSLAKSLELPRSAEVYLLERIRYIDEKPAGIESCYLPQEYYSSLTKYDFAERSLYKTLEAELQVPIARAEESVSARLAFERECDLLDCAAPLAVLTFTRLTYDADERVVEYSQRTYHPENYPLDISLYRN